MHQSQKDQGQKDHGMNARSLTHVFLAVLLFVAVASLQGTVVAYRAGMADTGSTAPAFLVAAYFAGLLAGAAMGPALIRRFGHIGLFTVAAIVAALGLFGFAFTDNFWAWGVLQLVTGFAVACHYVIVESWFNLMAGAANRARLFSLYMVCWFLGAGAGPLFMNIHGLDGGRVFYAMALAMLVAALLVIWGRRAPFSDGHNARMPLLTVLEASPLGFLGTLVVGVSFGAVFGLTAIVAHAQGLDEWQVSLFVAAFIVGGGLFQYPVGLLSDALGRGRVFAACALLAAVSAFLLLLPFSFQSMIALAVMFGGTSLPLYALSVSLVHDKLADEDRLAASGGLLLLNSKGSFLGPLAIGLLAGVWGHDAVFIMLGAGHLMLFLLCLLAKRQARNPLSAH